MRTLRSVGQRLTPNDALFLVIHKLDALRIQRLLQLGEVDACAYRLSEMRLQQCSSLLTLPCCERAREVVFYGGH